MSDPYSDANRVNIAEFFKPKEAPEHTFNPATNDWRENPCVPGNPSHYTIPLVVVPHDSTPLANTATSATIAQVFREAAGNPALYSQETVDYIRQLAKTNLWFLMTVILAHNGPFDLVNTHLHRDMANFRQSRYWTAPGARAAAFIPRSHLKSTIFTIAGTIWDLLRNPEERHLIVNANKDKALEFLHAIQQPFESNDFFRTLFPEYCPKSGDEWTKLRFVLPNRKRRYKDASVSVLSVTSAGEGTHVDALTIDDPVGLDDIDNTRSSNENMKRAKSFFTTADPALLISKRRSRIGFVGTRWAVDDVAELAVESCRRFHGYEDVDFTTRPDGKWDIYYRLCVEDGDPIYPEEWTAADFEEIARADWWNFATQYANKPQASGIIEFSDYDLKGATLSKGEDGYWLRYQDDPNEVSLAHCDVLLTCDPAGTEKGIKAKTSRTSIGMWALDGHGRYTRIWARVGYFDSVKLVDFLFRAHDLFPGYIRNTIIENNAMQKILLPIIRKEERLREKSIRPKGMPAQGDKFARIRNAFSLPLSRGLIYAVEGPSTYMALLEEIRLFPSSQVRVDVLDESEKALTNLRKPLTAEERVQRDEDEEDARVMAVVGDNYVGY